MQRMSEVGNWTIQLLIVQPTQEDRIICCQRILRMLVFCVNLGAFHTVAEILSGAVSFRFVSFPYLIRSSGPFLELKSYWFNV